MRKWIASLLCIAALLAVLPLPARAADSDKVRAVKAQAARCYQQCLATAGVESFAGTCGFMASHQLRNLGINSWFISEDGNQQFDLYSQMEQTSGGYYIDAYSAEDYSLIGILQLLTRGGTRDVYNLLVGFEWTNTEAGAMYGHVVFVNAILDGTVYFVESFPTSIGGAEGNVIECSIMEFANFFADWTVFDGVIHFGNGQYADCCNQFSTDVFVQTRFASQLRSQPCYVGQNKCTRMRSVAAGERLRATALLKNDRGDLYYRVEDALGEGYVAASACTVVRLNAEDLFTQELEGTDRVALGQKFSMTGAVWSKNSNVASVELRVTDSRGNLVLEQLEHVNDISCGVGGLSKALEFETLDEGIYQVELYAQAGCSVADGNRVVKLYAPVLLWGKPVQVGGKLLVSKASPIMQKQVQQDREGWFWENDNWYCYEQGKPLTGWISHLGVWYYLDETGMALTGQQEIDGKLRYFSATGALCSGWFITDKGTVYLSEEGTPVTGEQTIRGKAYVFDKKGILKKGNA